MRKTWDSTSRPSMTLLSFSAEARSLPNGFSKTTRRKQSRPSGQKVWRSRLPASVRFCRIGLTTPGGTER